MIGRAVMALGIGFSLFTRVKLDPGPVPAEWWKRTTAEAIAGKASRYDPGLMLTAARNRGFDVAGYAGAVSLMRRGDLGRVVWVRIRGRPRWWGPFLVVDCAGRINYTALGAMDRVLEFSAATWGALGLPEIPVSVVVSFAVPWPAEIGPIFH